MLLPCHTAGGGLVSWFSLVSYSHATAVPHCWWWFGFLVLPCELQPCYYHATLLVVVWLPGSPLWAPHAHRRWPCLSPTHHLQHPHHPPPPPAPLPYTICSTPCSPPSLQPGKETSEEQPKESSDSQQVGWWRLVVDQLRSKNC